MKNIRDGVNDVIRDLETEASELWEKLDSVSRMSPDQKNLLREQLEVIISALDDAKQSFKKDDKSGYFILPFAVACMTIGQVVEVLKQGESVSRLMSSYAKLRIENDPKQKDKLFVRECWQKWQENPTDYKGQAAFARDMLDKCEHLESAKVIETWCTQWKRENSNPAG
ncbi:MAG: hypothetical protein K8H84_13990 [Sulfuricella denitrificans]|nr:hypothetical protein [Sulfuricella denitrificans]